MVRIKGRVKVRIRSGNGIRLRVRVELYIIIDKIKVSKNTSHNDHQPFFC